MPRLLDLFCGAGGASMGYARAGFDVTGVDIEPHPSYPFTFHQADAMTFPLDGFDVVHASPPCQVFTSAGHLMRAQGNITKALDLIEPTRERLQAWGGVYVIENVVGAPLDGVTLCGSAFGLGVRRHRLFESNVLLLGAGCRHSSQGRPVGVYGRPGDSIPNGGRTASGVAEARAAMGIDWMQWRSNTQEWDDLKEAIPPAYTEYLGEQLLAHVQVPCG